MQDASPGRAGPASAARVLLIMGSVLMLSVLFWYGLLFWAELPQRLLWGPHWHAQRGLTAYVSGDCDAADEVFSGYRGLQGLVVRQRDLVAAYCLERSGQEDLARSAYLALINAYSRTDEAESASIRIHHLDRPKEEPAVESAPTAPVPESRIEQTYPDMLQMAGIEGWAYLRFDVTPTGAVHNIRVVDSDPRFLFELESIRAVQQWRYTPGPDGSRDVEIVLQFKMLPAQD